MQKLTLALAILLFTPLAEGAPRPVEAVFSHVDTPQSRKCLRLLVDPSSTNVLNRSLKEGAVSGSKEIVDQATSLFAGGVGLPAIAVKAGASFLTTGYAEGVTAKVRRLQWPDGTKIDFLVHHVGILNPAHQKLMSRIERVRTAAAEEESSTTSRQSRPAHHRLRLLGNRIAAALGIPAMAAPPLLLDANWGVLASAGYLGLTAMVVGKNIYDAQRVNRLEAKQFTETLIGEVHQRISRTPGSRAFVVLVVREREKHFLNPIDHHPNLVQDFGREALLEEIKLELPEGESYLPESENLSVADLKNDAFREVGGHFAERLRDMNPIKRYTEGVSEKDIQEFEESLKEKE